jgi:hypothetical protein
VVVQLLEAQTLREFTSDRHDDPGGSSDLKAWRQQ